jgi:hypothetical protein
MDKTYLNTLRKRKEELLNELGSIDNILRLYPDDQDKNKIATNPIKPSTGTLTYKDRVLGIVKDLGGQAYIAQIVTELKKQLPDKNDDSINTTARNYVHILKKDGRLKGELKGNNKWLYTII